MTKIIILGIDPGTRVTGYGIITTDGRAHEVVDFGCIRPPPQLKLPERYLILFEAVERLVEKFTPDELSVETQFFSVNPQSAMKLGMARSAALLAAMRKGVQVYEYAPKEAKRAVVGRGGASKQQVQGMVQALLKLSHLPEPEDASDALALALCHAQKRRSLCMNS